MSIMKVALCFTISYEHNLNKENIWREWIEHNKDIINIYFYYKDYNKIQSSWIREHALPINHIRPTSYYHVIPAYISLMNYAYYHDNKNQWFCFLTDSCCPIISPKRFRYLFFEHYNESVMNWKYAWWNTTFHKRANLALLPREYRLANDPWFVLTRKDIFTCLKFVRSKTKLTNLICSGGLANESLFAIILHIANKLNGVICSVTHATDWCRMTSPTSPHLFKDANSTDIAFIEDELTKNKNVMFIRKIAPEFPDDILIKYIYTYSKKYDDELKIRKPFCIQNAFFCLLLIIPFFYVIVKNIRVMAIPNLDVE